MADPTDTGALAQLRAQLAAPRGLRRIEALLAADDPTTAVAALEPTEFFELVHSAGFEDAGELMALATPTQIQGCLDLEGWDRNRIVPAAMRPWLAALLDTNFEKVGEVWGGLDAELRALLLQQHTIISDLTLGEEPDDTDDRPLYITVDRFFGVRLTGDAETNRLTQHLIEDLYRADANLARHTLQTARSEPAIELEDSCHRWRAGRLADAGYVDFYEALIIFRPLEVADVSIEHDAPVLAGSDVAVSPLPAVVAEEVLGKTFLARALDRVDGAELPAIEAALMILVNQVLAAGRVKPGQAEVMQRGARYATATLSLGLELVARGDLERAAAALRRVPLVRLFRVGYTRPLQLARLAQALAPRAACAGAPAAPVVAGLCSPRPLLAQVVDEPPAAGLRPFESQRDLRTVADVLGRLTLRVALVESLGVNVVAMAQLPEPRPQLDDHLRTALARVLAGGELTAAALSQAEVAQVRALLAGGAFADAARARAARAIAARIEALGLGVQPTISAAVTATLIDDVAAALAPLTGDDVDPRFVTGLLVDGQRS